ncbi:MAG: hypothetical protein H6832_14880 [Planctomycetes bacterium]|nr:hypothetical protein [Planctomycetota bacterium]
MNVLILGGLAIIAAIWTPFVLVKVIATILAAGLTFHSSWMHYCTASILRNLSSLNADTRRDERAIARGLYWRRN